jgi:hypothetical protein
MDKLSTAIDYLVAYGKKHASDLSDEQKCDVVQAMILADLTGTVNLWCEFFRDRCTENFENFSEHANGLIDEKIVVRNMKIMFFDYYIDLFSELFEAHITETEDNFLGYAVNQTMAMYLAHTELREARYANR